MHREQNGNFILREDFPDVDYGLDFYYNGFFPFLPKQYRYLKLSVDYAKERDEAIVELKGISFQPQSDKDGTVFRFDEDEKTGKILKTSNAIFTKNWVIVYHLGDVMVM